MGAVLGPETKLKRGGKRPRRQIKAERMKTVHLRSLMLIFASFFVYLVTCFHPLRLIAWQHLHTNARVCMNVCRWTVRVFYLRICICLLIGFCVVMRCTQF